MNNGTPFTQSSTELRRHNQRVSRWSLPSARIVATLAATAVLASACAPSFDSSRLDDTSLGGPTEVAPIEQTTLEEYGVGGSYVRPFGPNAPWNIPVAQLEPHPEEDAYSANFWNYSSLAGELNPDKKGQIDLSFDTWSSPIYDAREATTTIRVFTAYYGYPGTVKNGGRIPWNPAWKASPGEDAEMIIIDPDRGLEWDLWLVQHYNPSGCFSLFSGFDMYRDLCVGRASMVTGPDDQPANYYTYEGGFPSKGSGLQNLALMVTAEEVADGAIRHAVGMDVYNTMFGSMCDGNAPSPAGASVPCAHYLSPSTRVEWPNPAPGCAQSQANTPERRARTLPEGMRFSLEISDQEIEQWLNAAGHTGALRETARIFAVALRDYGWVISDTSCFGSSVPTDGVTNPTTAAIWRELGVNGDQQTSILDGLIQQHRIQVHAGADPIPTGRSRAVAPNAVL